MAGRSSRSSDRDRIRSGLFEPRSLAVIGASSHPEKVGYAVLMNIIKSDYPGEVFPVNPKAKEIEGIDCYPDVRSLPDMVDLAVIIVPAGAVPDVVSQCVDRQVKCAVVISAGFREVGLEGRRLEREIVKRARAGGMRLQGPNCLGTMNTSLPMNATFSRQMSPPGSIGVISQSGAICTSLLDWARQEGVGFSKLISLGNTADLDEGDFLDALAHDDDTTVISMYVEGVSDGARFFASVREASKRKPVVMLKAGTTQAGAKAASSHTGAMAGSAGAYESVCKQAPALMADSTEELVELSRSLATQAVPTGPRIAIVTNAGGPGIIASDACERRGLVLASVSGRTLETLERYLPPAASLHNPVDVLGDADAFRYAVTIEALLADPAVDAVVVILTPQAMTEVYRTAEEIVKIKRNSPKTLITSFMGAGSVRSAVNRMQKAGIPNIPYPDRAVVVLSRMYERRLHMKLKHPPPSEFEVDSTAVRELFASYLERERMQVSPEDCRRVLAAYGIDHAPFVVASTSEQAADVAAGMGYPVVLKIVSPQILHKTDIGGVVLNVRNRRQLIDETEGMLSRVARHMPAAEVEGIGVQKMVPQGRELIIGLTRDPQFGPMVMVGFGGIYVEAFKDVAFRIAPVNTLETSEMLRELRAFRLLEGLRGEEPSDIPAVEEVLMRISQLATDQRVLTEMDINPLMVYNAGAGCTCVDVRITLGGERS